LVRRTPGSLSRNFIRPATTVSRKRLAVAIVAAYQRITDDEPDNEQQEAQAMQIDCHPDSLSSLRAFAAPFPCPHCGDLMVAPMMSEFVVGGEIRHHWECDACGEASCTSIELAID
jgi:predicted RNA-binding Zn-ribbon protein involved in translation (DUF1610 family)